MLTHYYPIVIEHCLRLSRLTHPSITMFLLAMKDPRQVIFNFVFVLNNLCYSRHSVTGHVWYLSGEFVLLLNGPLTEW